MPKKQITCVPAFAPVRTNGSGDDLSLSVGMKVFRGPASVTGHPAALLLDKSEALSLALDLLSQLPARWLAANGQVKTVAKLRTLVNHLDMARQSAKNTAFRLLVGAGGTNELVGKYLDALGKEGIAALSEDPETLRRDYGDWCNARAARVDGSATWNEPSPTSEGAFLPPDKDFDELD